MRMGRAQIISVNVGLPREVTWKNLDITTGIFKEPVSGRIAVRRLNLDGDRQADLSVHGGPNKAVYGYPSEHYPFWRKELQRDDLSWGGFGENLTTAGLSEDTLHIGDRLRIGSTLLVVTQPRIPCYKLSIRIGRDDILKRFLMSGRSGFYFAVLEEGELGVGDEIRIEKRDPEQVSVSDINRPYAGAEDSDLLRPALRLEALPEGWRESLAQRVR
jgi:MOSC domain-containing protein YiiM